MGRFNFVTCIELFCNYKKKNLILKYKFTIVVSFGYNFIYCRKRMVALSLVILTFFNFVCFSLSFAVIWYL